MALSQKQLFNYAAEVTEALTDAYVQNNQLKYGPVLNGLTSLTLSLIDLALHGFKANTPLVGLYQLFQANQRPKPVLTNKPELDLAPELRQQALPRPRPY